MARLGVLEIDQLPRMQVLETLSAESIIAARMQRFIAIWRDNDPPAAANYDVQNLEFDPIRITQEANAYFELLLRDRVNQAAKSVTLAFASGNDLEGIASRYPGGVPRLPGESDDRYRVRVWLSSNTLSPHGVYESYVFWALTAVPSLRDVTASAKTGTPNVTLTLMADGTPVLPKLEGTGITAFPSPRPTTADIDTVRQYVLNNSRKALTDVITVKGPKVVAVEYVIRYWLFPGWDMAGLQLQLWTAVASLIEKQRWLGYSHTRSAMEAALMVSGVFNVKVDKPVDDVIIDIGDVVEVTKVTLVYAGRKGFEGPQEP